MKFPRWSRRISLAGLAFWFGLAAGAARPWPQLDTIILPEVIFISVPLSAVVGELGQGASVTLNVAGAARPATITVQAVQTVADASRSPAASVPPAPANPRSSGATTTGLQTADPAQAKRLKIAQLVRNGQIYYQQKEFSTARTTLEEALVLDPANDAANYYLRLAKEEEFAEAQRRRTAAQNATTAEVLATWNLGGDKQNGRVANNADTRSNATMPFLTMANIRAFSVGRQLDTIILPEVIFDGVPLSAVVERLDAEAKRFDPEKRGVNFLINDVAPSAPLRDAAGNPVVGERVPLSSGLVRLSRPLRQVTLRQALDAICLSAELPTQFSVENYGVVFLPRNPEAYFTRTFRLDTNTFLQGLQGVVSTPATGVPPGGVTGNSSAGNAGNSTSPTRATVPATVSATTAASPAEINAQVRRYFQSAGVTSLGATNGATQVVFNAANGLLLVRGTAQELSVIAQAVQKVQQPIPPDRAPHASFRDYQSTDRTSPSWRERYNRKLDELIIPEVRFTNAPLEGVMEWVDAIARRFDPEKQGINVIFNDVIGNPPPMHPKALRESIRIHLPVAVTNQSLRRVFETICQAATVPLDNDTTVPLKFTVNDYAVMLTPKLPEPPTLLVRTFKVDPATFIQGLASVDFDAKQLRPGSRAALEQALRSQAWANAPAGTNGTASAITNAVTAELNHLVRLYFAAAGVANLSPTNGPTVPQLFFNDRTGLMLVRATLPDLDIIQQAVELLNTKPPRVSLEATLVALTPNDPRPIGNDRFVGSTNGGPAAKSPGTAIDANAVNAIWTARRQAVQLTGILVAEQATAILQALEKRGDKIFKLPMTNTLSGAWASFALPAESPLGEGKISVLPTASATQREVNFTINYPNGIRPATTQGIVFNGQTVMVLHGLASATADAKTGAKSPPWVLFLTPTIEGAPVDQEVSLPNGKIFPAPNGTSPPLRR